MARPSIPKTDQRTTPVRTYWTDQEYLALLRLAQAARLPVSAYIRLKILGNSVDRQAA